MKHAEKQENMVQAYEKKNAVNRNWPEEVHALHLQKYFNHVFILNKLKNENKQMETKKVKTNTKN